MQTPAAAALAEVFVSAAERLYDAATEQETPNMWETGREISSWVLAVCHRAEGETARKRTRQRPVDASQQAPVAFTMSEMGAAAASPVYLPGLQPVAADPG